MNKYLLKTAKVSSWNTWAAYKNYQMRKTCKDDPKHAEDFWRKSSQITDDLWEKALLECEEDSDVIEKVEHWNKCVAKYKKIVDNSKFKPLIS
jgi:hypothetical protein